MSMSPKSENSAVKSKRTKARISAISDSVPKWSMSNARRVTRVQSAALADKKSWVSKYHYFVYAVFLLDVIGIIVYLCYIGYHMNDSVMYLEYTQSIGWLNRNTYSLFVPFGTIPLLMVLTYHVRHQLKVVDGDYFGLSAFFLLLIAILIHDATKLIDGHSFMISMKENDPTDENNFNRLKDQQSLFDAFYREIRVLHLRTPDPNIVETVKFTEIPMWIQEFQRDANPKNSPPGCCGVTGVEDWRQYQGMKAFNDTPWACCCESTTETECHATSRHCDFQSSNPITEGKSGCWESFLDLLSRIYEETYICMIVLATLHILCMIAYTVHWLAMKKLLPDEEEMEDDGLASAMMRIFMRRGTTVASEAKIARRASSVVQPNSSLSTMGRRPSRRHSLADLDPGVEEVVENEENVFTRIFGRNSQKKKIDSVIDA